MESGKPSKGITFEMLKPYEVKLSRTVSRGDKRQPILGCQVPTLHWSCETGTMIDKEKIPKLTYKELIELFGIEEAENIIIKNKYKSN